MGTDDLARQLIAEADRYEADARKLRDAAAILTGESGGNSRTHANGHTPVRPAKKNSRLEQIRKFLIEHGPARRAEILAGTDIPVGSVATVLKTENFDRDDEGRWSVKDGSDDDS